jgi:hypothetical protein
VQQTLAEMDPTTAALEKEHEALTKVSIFMPGDFADCNFIDYTSINFNYANFYGNLFGENI